MIPFMLRVLDDNCDFLFYTNRYKLSNNFLCINKYTLISLKEKGNKNKGQRKERLKEKGNKDKG